MNTSIVIAVSLNIKWLLPFLLLSFLFIVVLTAVIYKIMWLRLDKMIKEKEKEKEKEDIEKTEEETLKKEEKEVLSKMNETLKNEEQRKKRAVKNQNSKQIFDNIGLNEGESEPDTSERPTLYQSTFLQRVQSFTSQGEASESVPQFQIYIAQKTILIFLQPSYFMDSL